MPKINHPNIGDIQQYAYLQGTVTSVDAGNDTACINIPDISMEASDVPLFYHCSHDVAERSNGALEGAAAAFTDGDEVIVQCRIIDGARYEAVRVIGFVEGQKPCEHKFYIRPKFNGVYAQKGKEKVEIKYTYYEEDHSEKKTVFGSEVSGSDPDLYGYCGPFILSGEVYASDPIISVYLDSNIDQAVLGRTAGDRTAFLAFYEVSEGEHDYIVGSDNKYVKRLFQKEATSKLLNSTKTTVTVDGKDYDCYNVEFTDLKITRRRPSDFTQANTGTGWIWPCVLSPINPYWKGDDEHFTYVYTFAVWGYAYVERDPVTIYKCSGTTGGGDYDQYVETTRIGSITPDYPITSDRFCVLTDENGDNPSFTNWKAKCIHDKWTRGCLEWDEWEEECLEWCYDEAVDTWEWFYEMINTPTDDF